MRRDAILGHLKLMAAITEYLEPIPNIVLGELRALVEVIHDVVPVLDTVCPHAPLVLRSIQHVRTVVALVGIKVLTRPQSAECGNREVALLLWSVARAVSGGPKVRELGGHRLGRDAEAKALEGTAAGRSIQPPKEDAHDVSAVVNDRAAAIAWIAGSVELDGHAIACQIPATE